MVAGLYTSIFVLFSLQSVICFTTHKKSVPENGQIAIMIKSNAKNALTQSSIRQNFILTLASSPHYPQDDFDDLCEALTDRLGPTSPTLSIPACPPSPSDVHSSRSLITPAVPCSKAADTADAACVAQGLPASSASQNATPPMLAQADLALLTAELQTLAEETGRLKQGLDRLVALTEISPRRPGSCPWEDDFARPEACSRPLGSSAGADEAGGRELWLKGLLLGAVEALLKELLAGGLLPGAGTGLFSGCQGPTHGKKARAAAAAQAAQAAQTAAQGNMLELTEGRRHLRPGAGIDQSSAGGWTGPGPAAGPDSDDAVVGLGAANSGLWGSESAAGGPSSGYTWHCEHAGKSICAGGVRSLLTTTKDSAQAQRLSTLPTYTENQSFTTTLQFRNANVPPGLSAWSAQGTPRQAPPTQQTPALPACNTTRWYDDPAGPAVLASEPSNDGGWGSSSYRCREVHESALLPPAAPPPILPPPAEQAHGGGPPGLWAEADGLPWHGAGGAPRISLGAASVANQLQTQVSRGTAADGAGLQMWQQGLSSPSSPSAIAVGTSFSGLPWEAASAACARYCI